MKVYVRVGVGLFVVDRGRELVILDVDADVQEDNRCFGDGEREFDCWVEVPDKLDEVQECLSGKRRGSNAEIHVLVVCLYICVDV